MATLEMQFSGVQWEPCENVVEVEGGLHATHHGVWDFNGFAMRVYRLNNGKTMIHADDMNNFFASLNK